ncbi:winged helix-turn-helix transcriptional regulator [Fibrella sp. HMF5405]|uniref:Winged helix-turn-helix transcriptional regulator n=1 Tax=Fibrella forsythiae TaxID=2817061 RepID=A0ABS3JCX2_9BACT|nr:winged helix-turn-helix transcriptional regulator [Fibrella forsythiae]
MDSVAPHTDLPTTTSPGESGTAALSTRFGACLLFSANALARSLTTIGDGEFAQLGLSYSHAYLLNEIALNPGMTPTYLSETLLLSPSTITRLIEKLEGKGLARREMVGKHTMVFATQAGEDLAPAVDRAWQANWAKFSEKLGEDNALALTRQIFAAAERLNADPSGE